MSSGATPAMGSRSGASCGPTPTTVAHRLTRTVKGDRPHPDPLVLPAGVPEVSAPGCAMQVEDRAAVQRSPLTEGEVTTIRRACDLGCLHGKTLLLATGQLRS